MSVTTVEPTHTCFDDAFQVIDAILFEDRSAYWEMKLIHGICRMPDGTLFAHAWVEHNGLCIFYGVVDGAPMCLCGACDEFYAECGVQSFTCYSMQEVGEKITEHGFAGPWEPEYKAFCADGYASAWGLGRNDAGDTFIRCGYCGSESYNRNDIEQRYCGHCRRFLDAPN